MNIAFIIGGMEKIGGIGRVTSILTDELVKNPEYNIILISYVNSGSKKHYNTSNKIKQYHLYEKATTMTSSILFKRGINKLKKILRKENVDILIAAGALFYPISYFATRGLKCKCYFWEHTNPKIGSDYKFQKLARKFSIKADKTIVLTDTALDFYKNMGIFSSKLVQIPNPIDPALLKLNKYDLNSKKIISVGRLSYPKNFSLAIEIASEILPLYSDWTWDIYGSGDEEETLRKKITTLNLVNRVNLKGSVKNLYDKYPQYSFLVMTSRYEGFPMSLIEAGSMGLPLISFDIETGPNEIISTGKNGFLIDPLNKDQMIEKIKILIDNPDIRTQMSINSSIVHDKFNMLGILEAWGKILK